MRDTFEERIARVARRMVPGGFGGRSEQVAPVAAPSGKVSTYRPPGSSGGDVSTLGFAVTLQAEIGPTLTRSVPILTGSGGTGSPADSVAGPPWKTGAAAEVAHLILSNNASIALVVPFVVLIVSNAAADQMIFLASGTINLTAGQFMDPVTGFSITDQVGTDLSYDGSTGAVESAAGGVFWSVGAVQVS